MSIKDRAVKGVAWTSIGTIGGGVLTLLVNIFMARMLTPADFGLIELLLVFSFLSDVIVDSGFSQAIIRDSDVNEDALSSVFYLNLFIGCGLYAILYFLSPYIALYYHSPELTSLARFTFLTIICHSLLVTPNANLNRQLNFKPFAIATLLSTLISGTTCCILAHRGLGVWALALNIVLTYFLRTLIVWFQIHWCPKLTFQIKYIKKYFAFGSKLLAMGLIDKFVTNLESLLIGRYYSKSNLGYFSQGRKLDSYVGQMVLRVVNTVSYPTLAKLKDNETNLKEGYRTALKITICGITPLIVCFISCSENVICLLLGSKWLPSAPYLQMWAIVGYLVMIYSFFTNTYLVKGTSGRLLTLSVIRQITRILAIVLLVRISIMATMYGIVFVTALSCILYVYFGGKQIGYHIQEFIIDLFPFTIIGIGGGLLAWWGNFYISGESVLFRLICQIAIILASYILLLLILRNRTILLLFDIIKNIVKRNEKNKNTN